MRIVRARPDDAAALTAIAFEAKRHWGYPENWILRWTDLLTVRPDYVKAHSTFMAVVDGEPVGFSALGVRGDEAALEHLWVRPPWMGRGVGRALYEFAEQIACQNGAARLSIESDPHAEGFYRKMGATVCGRKPASLDGQERFLPILEKAFAGKAGDVTRIRSS